MNKQANILFISPSISGNSAEPQDALSQHAYFQQLIYASLARNGYVGRFEILGRRLATIARHAHLVRQMDAVEQASQVMLALPIPSQFKGIARYYQALCIKHKGDFDGARRSLERAVEEASPQYRARALLTIGATFYESGEVDAALPFYLAAGRGTADRDLLTLAESQRMTAVVRSIHGDHKQALADLERLFPLVRAIGKYYPAAYYDFLNSLAVEFGEVGRLSEAERALSIALTSPFARAYPEWTETRAELKAKRTCATPSVVAVNQTYEVIPAPQTQRRSNPNLLAAFRWLGIKLTSIQTAIIAIARLMATGNHLANRNILDQLGRCIRSRAPPAQH